MSVLYEFRCPEHGLVEAFAGRGAQVAPCPVCGVEAARRYSPPVTDCLSFGKNQFVNRRPVWKQTLKDDEQASHARNLRIAAGAGTVFGQMPGQREG